MSERKEIFLTDEGLTDGLTDEEAQELLSWLLDLDRAYISFLRRLGREIARLARDYGVPVYELIALVEEIAWDWPRGE